MIALIYRGSRIFLKNKEAILGSLVGSLILIVLSVFLLGDSFIQQLDFLDEPKTFIYAWMFAGVIGIVAASSSMVSVQQLIKDRQSGVFQDFRVSPLSNSEILWGYYLSTYFISLLMSLVISSLTKAYLSIVFDAPGLSLAQEAQLLLITLITVFNATSMMFWIATIFHKMESFSSIVTVIGPAIGFLTGSYVVISSLAPSVQNVIRYFPLTSGVSMMRNLLTENILVNETSQVASEVREAMGITMGFENQTATPVLILLGTGSVFLLLALVNVRRMKFIR